MPYVQRVEGHDYILVAVFQTTLERTKVLMGADVYSRDGAYKGFWPKENMPEWLPERLNRYFAHRTQTYEHGRIIKCKEELWL
jgi:hypothetical protein